MNNLVVYFGQFYFLTFDLNFNHKDEFFFKLSSNNEKFIKLRFYYSLNSAQFLEFNILLQYEL